MTPAIKDPAGTRLWQCVFRARYRSADLNHQLQDGKLKTKPKQHCQNDRRTQRAKQAAFEFRRFALLPGLIFEIGGDLIFEIGGNIRHDTFLTIACAVSASNL